MINPSLLYSDLAVFSDLGVDLPKVIQDDDGTVRAQMVRNGDRLNLTFLTDGIIELAIGENRAKFASYKSLLASEYFGKLRDWAAVQSSVLDEEMRLSAGHIPTVGRLHSIGSTANVQDVNDVLAQYQFPVVGSVNLLLIDGPAGMGKTEFIKQLAHERATSFRINQRPLILHVQSRGRVLTFLQDLIAFSLQSLRLSVTFDQIPVLARNGLVVIAIDGFDELGDPAGYETAWAQLSDLINDVRGEGTLILAGRETFIGRERLQRDIQALNLATDFVDSLTLITPTPSEGLEWLRSRGWDEDNLKTIELLFEPRSFALRPIFLSKLGEETFVSTMTTVEVDDTLTFLIRTMIKRETTKFGQAVEAALGQDKLEKFVESFLGEIARDMADNQSESTDETSIKWAVEFALDRVSPNVPEDIKRLLQNRALVMAFLTVDDRVRYRRFSHAQLQNYFLARETFEVICRPEMPKYLRRNIFASDFLITFCDALDEIATSSPALIHDFVKSGLEMYSKYFDVDRGARNLAALLLCCAPFTEVTGDIRIHGASIDEAVIRGTSGRFILQDSTINLLDIREADIASVLFENCTVAGVVMNALTRVNPSLQPSYIQLEQGDEVDFVQRQEVIAEILEKHGGRKVAESQLDEVERSMMEEHPIFILLDRALRFRAYWIRGEAEKDDVLTHKIVSDPYWPNLTDLLIKHELLRKETRQAAGRPSTFFHIRRPEELASRTGAIMHNFYEDLYKFVRSEQLS